MLPIFNSVKNFRTNITKSYSFVLILLGFVMHFAAPVQESKAHSEFTSWLDAKVKSEENASVRLLIEDLADDEAELNEVIQKASDIVSENSDDFKFPFSEGEDVYRVIIDEWNAYQNSAAGMGKAVITENVKSNAVSQKEISTLKKSAETVSESCMNNLVGVEINWAILTGEVSHKPFQSGVAINAP